MVCRQSHDAQAPDAQNTDLNPGSPAGCTRGLPVASVVPVSQVMSEPDPIAKLQSSFPSAVVPYSSLTELRKLWRAMDRREGGLKLTIVLVLGDSFAGFLPGLIRRQHPALRLVIAAPAGRLPGFIDEVDLAECTASLGFHMISVYPDAGTAVAEGNSPLAWQERCVTFMPAASQPILI